MRNPLVALASLLESRLLIGGGVVSAAAAGRGGLDLKLGGVAPASPGGRTVSR